MSKLPFSTRAAAWKECGSAPEEEASRVNNADHWRDFAGSEQLPVDADGHGTAVVTTLLRAARNAEVYVGRVAEKRPDLSSCAQNVVDVSRDLTPMRNHFVPHSTCIYTSPRLHGLTTRDRLSSMPWTIGEQTSFQCPLDSRPTSLPSRRPFRGRAFQKEQNTLLCCRRKQRSERRGALSCVLAARHIRPGHGPRRHLRRRLQSCAFAPPYE